MENQTAKRARTDTNGTRDLKCWAVLGAKQPFTPYIASAPVSLKPRDVEVKVTHCGLCSLDVAIQDDEWHMGKFPDVPGHEIAGVVTAVGERVRLVKVGDRVVVGFEGNSCGTCPDCISGDIQQCPERKTLGMDGNFGGFAERVTVTEECVHRIPEGMSSAGAAPLLCIANCVYASFVQYGLKPIDRVAVAGLGAIGQMAVRMAVKWGCHVTVVSTSPAKKTLALKLGASEFVHAKDENETKALAGKVDFMLVCYGGCECNTKADIHVSLANDLVPMMRHGGKIIVLSVFSKPIEVPMFPLMMKRLTVASTGGGTHQDMENMLKFCQRHNIEADIEVVPFSKVNDAIARWKRGDGPSRFVLEADS
mmetsp:Transcript_40982/g.66458  ORF Transcript_40982/g.66458 Transcript_40982/m.66458 type:complete len:365 (+) Transcript_40982:179-1273(+)|eukprot:CAMPEP_0184664622 /NCGR_PEP_ID=MMETSP0308-20130426/53743_1 /TAXON_ID=38269 /ORGANISM="Gloeochaete witrockiana, Strain SAG 46.84" /LENGTH=364 /DNA_ID=CAMNT_0027108153 /DNA_START=97 /DNA_END=1191 /DNA_ORIENTATION=-